MYAVRTCLAFLPHDRALHQLHHSTGSTSDPVPKCQEPDPQFSLRRCWTAKRITQSFVSSFPLRVGDARVCACLEVLTAKRGGTSGPASRTPKWGCTSLSSAHAPLTHRWASRHDATTLRLIISAHASSHSALLESFQRFNIYRSHHP